MENSTVITNEGASARPKRRPISAWFVGMCFYMVLAMDVFAEDGGFAFPFQAILGTFITALFVGIAFLLGQLLRMPSIANCWYSTPFVSLALIALAFVVLFFGRDLGLTTILRSEQTESTYQALHPLAGYGSMLVAIFATLHFSHRNRP
jgi:hypothetical protein